MSNVMRSTDHTLDGAEISYSFVHQHGLTTGGMVTILAFNEDELVDGPAGKVPKQLGKIEIHKDALLNFAAELVRRHKAHQILSVQNDLQILGV